MQLGKHFHYFRYLRLILDTCSAFILSRLLAMRGVSIGSNVKFLGAPLISLVPGSRIVIGCGSVLCSRSKNTALGVNHSIVLRTLTANSCLLIGEGVRMSGTTICAAGRVEIGSRCVIGANVTITDTDFHSLDPIVRSSPSDKERAINSPVVIGSDVFIGVGAIILKGVSIGNFVVIGAGSVVTKSVPEYAIVAGNPAKRVGTVAYGGGHK